MMLTTPLTAFAPQTLPPGRLLPILDALQTLVRDYGASVVISTATQPAFSSPTLPDDARLSGVREIVPPSSKLFDRLRRVRVRWPDLSAGPTSYATLTDAEGSPHFSTLS